MAGLRVGALITSPAPASIPIWRPETGNTKKFFKMYITTSVSPVLYQIEMKFQLLPHIFGIDQSNGTIEMIVTRKRKSEIQYGSC